MSIIDKLDKVEYLLKHQPGRHDQQRHAGERGSAGESGVTFYHGTKAAVIQSVLEDGLKVGKKWHGRDPSVYVAEGPELAQAYAMDRTLNRPFGPNDVLEGVVFEISPPAGQVDKFLLDNKMPHISGTLPPIPDDAKKAGWRLEQDIPADWIAGYTVYRVKDPGNLWRYNVDEKLGRFEEVERVRLKELGLRYFVPIFIDGR